MSHVYKSFACTKGFFSFFIIDAANSRTALLSEGVTALLFKYAPYIFFVSSLTDFTADA